jgi:hypothetical protein
MKRSYVVLAFCCLAQMALAEEPYPWDLVKQPKFRKAYHAILGERAREKWLSTLDGPSTPATKTSILGIDYLVMQSCKAHDCGAHHILILYSPASGVAYAKLYEEGKISVLGKPTGEISSALDKLYDEQFGEGDKYDAQKGL